MIEEKLLYLELWHHSKVSAVACVQGQISVAQIMALLFA